MARQTSTIGGEPRPFKLSELTDLLHQQGGAVTGFIVSPAIYALLVRKTIAREIVFGTRVVCDPQMPATDYEIVTTQAAWDRRMGEIRGAAR